MTMMTNYDYMEHLDLLSTRVGHVDKKTKLPNADGDVIFRLLRIVFK